MVKSIKKRNGQVVPFKIEKIINAMYKASVAVGDPNWQLAESLSKNVVERLNKKIKKGGIPQVEEVQDIVEQVLIETNHAKMAKAYILYRQHRAEIRHQKEQILNKEEIDEVDKKFDNNALRVLASRYLRKSEDGKIIESPKQLFQRVATHTALPSLFYDQKVFQKKGGAPERKFEEFDFKKLDGKLSIGKYKLNEFHLEGLKRLFDRFAKNRQMKISWPAFLDLIKKGYFNKYEDEINTYYNLMVSRRFLPNTPAIANFGNYLGMGSACFTLGIKDSIDSIMDSLKAASIIFKSGGGVGYNFSKLRPEGDFVKTTGGLASGPISFMSMFDNMTDVIKQGGCIATDSLVRTDKGLMPINNLLNAPEFKSNQTRHFVYDGKDFHHAFLAMNNGRAEAYEIRTELGTELKSTYNHLITVVSRQTGNLVWQQVNNLKEGEWAVLVLGGHSGKEISLPPFDFKQHFNSQPLTIPAVLTKELAELLGLYMADGCINNGRFIFSVDLKDKDLTQRIAYLMKSVFGLKLSSRWKKPGQRYVDLVFHSKDLERYFKKLNWIKNKALNAFIPQEILLSKSEIACAFLRGLFEGDGTTHSDGYPQLTSISKNLISQTQQLLLGLGMVSSVNKKSASGIKDHKGKNDIYVLRILTNRAVEKFKKNINFISNRKTENFNRYNRNKKIEYSDLIPYASNVFAQYYDYVGRGSGPGRGKKGADRAYYRAVQHYIKGDRLLTRATLISLMDRFEFLKNDPVLKELAQEKYFFSKIASLKKVEHIHTMEIEVPASGSYVANGFLVHNIRRGANMGILNSDHPDIEKFIHAKEGNKALKNFNISIMLKPEFWTALKEKKLYSLINPRNGKVVNEIDPQQLLDMISYQAWESAEPGVLFYDRINENNPFLKGLGPIESTNPCGEVNLYPNESCNLGSMNVWSYLKRNGDKKPHFDWQQLEEDVKIATKFLDNVVDVNKYPLKEIEEMSLSTRKLGLGLMGLGNLLYDTEVQFNSKEGLDFMGKLMEFINYYSKSASIDLAKERGKMPFFDKTFYSEGKLPFAGYKYRKSWNFNWKEISKKIKRYGIRNGFTTVIAPTGSISMIAGCSSGIEPVFSLVFEKNVAIGSFYYVDPVFEEKMLKEGLMDEALIKDVAMLGGSVQKLTYIPPRLKKYFVTAMDISPKDHVKVLAIFQKWTDSSISKTNNLPATATVDDVKEIYNLAHELGCKGVTIYRDKSLKTQVLNSGTKKHEKKQDSGELIAIKDEKAKGLSIYHKAGSKENSDTLDLSPTTPLAKLAMENGLEVNGVKNCPLCKTVLAKQEGCTKCPSCGWGMCL